MKIPTQWKMSKLGDVAEKVAMGPFGSNIKVETFVDEGVPVISGNHLRGVRLEDNSYNFVAVEHADRLASANVKRGDVIFTHAGNIGQVAYIPSNSKYTRYILSQRQFYLRPKTKELSAEYLAYYFHSPVGHHSLMTYASQVGVPSIAQPVTNLKSTEVLLPPFEAQVSIVEVLLSLDKKIELLQKQNETIEQMAQTLFENLFETKTEESLQAGWKYKNLGDLVEINPTETLKKGSLVPYLEMSALPTKGSWTEKPVVRAFSSGTKFRNKDTLLARITPCLENGKTAFIQCLQEGQIAWGSTEFIVIRPIKPLPPEYGYLLARSNRFRDYAIQMMSGTSGRQRVQTDMLSKYQTVLPDEKSLKFFSDIVRAYFEKVKQNSIQIEILSDLRNLLLPKLMTGEITINK